MGGLTTPPLPTGSERLLLHLLLAEGLCVRRMTSVAAVAHNSDHPLSAKLRYPMEWMAAVAFAWILHSGGRWVAAPEPSFLHGARCLGVPEGCCAKGSLPLGGDRWCWEYYEPRTYSLQRCCQSRYVAVTLQPSSETLAEWYLVWRFHFEPDQTLPGIVYLWGHIRLMTSLSRRREVQGLSRACRRLTASSPSAVC